MRARNDACSWAQKRDLKIEESMDNIQPPSSSTMCKTCGDVTNNISERNNFPALHCKTPRNKQKQSDKILKGLFKEWKKYLQNVRPRSQQRGQLALNVFLSKLLLVLYRMPFSTGQ